MDLVHRVNPTKSPDAIDCFQGVRPICKLQRAAGVCANVQKCTESHWKTRVTVDTLYTVFSVDTNYTIYTKYSPGRGV